MEPINYPATLDDPAGDRPLTGDRINPAYRGPVPDERRAGHLAALERALPEFDLDYDPFAGGYFLTSPVNDPDGGPYLVFGNAGDFGDEPPDSWRADRCRGDGPVVEPDGGFGIVLPGCGYDPAGVPALAARLREIALGFGIVPRTAAVAG